MTTPKEKAQCVSWFIKTKSDVQAQRNFVVKYSKRAPARQWIRNWHKQFVETRTLLLKSRNGWPKTSEMASSVFVSHLAVAQQSPSALLSFGLRERCCVPHHSKRHK